MAGNKPQVTNDKIYELVDRMRVELTKKIEDTSSQHRTELAELRGQFQNLEAGRLTRAEQNIQDMRVEMIRMNDVSKENTAVLNTKMVIFVGIAIFLLTMVANIIAKRIWP